MSLMIINYENILSAAGQPFYYIMESTFAVVVPCLVTLFGLTPIVLQQYIMPRQSVVTQSIVTKLVIVTPLHKSLHVDLSLLQVFLLLSEKS